MSNELTINASINYDDGSSAFNLSCPPDLSKQVTENIVAAGKTTLVEDTNTAINLGAVTDIGYLVLVNRGTVAEDYVKVKLAETEDGFAILRPNGGPLLLEGGPAMEELWLQAIGGNTSVDHLICNH